MLLTRSPTRVAARVIYSTPSVFKYKQNLLFWFIRLMMHVIHVMNHMHH